MTGPKVDRVGQIVAGCWEVVEDFKRTKAGAVVWRLVHVETGEERYRRTSQIIREDRSYQGLGQ